MRSWSTSPSPLTRRSRDERDLRVNGLGDVDHERIDRLLERGELAREQRRGHEVPAARGDPRPDRSDIALEMDDAQIAGAREPIAVRLLER